MTDHWQKNIEVLRGCDAELCSRLEREPASVDVETIPCRSGDVTARVRGVTLHSTYDPRQEARKLVADFVEQHQSEFDRARGGTQFFLVILGFGMGYHVEELIAALDRTGWYSDRTRVVVI